MTRPELLAYRARDGIYETRFADDRLEGESFNDFLKRALTWSAESTGDFRILDTFLSDTIHQPVLEFMFRMAEQGGSPVQLLLLDPRSPYAEARAGAIGGDTALARASKGLEIIASALEHALHGRELSGQRTHDEMIQHVRNLGKDINLELRFYSAVPVAPLFVFRDLAIVGRYSSSKSSGDMPWHLVVRDSGVELGMFGILRQEFEFLWEGAAQPREFRVFLSYNSGEADDAQELQGWLESMTGVKVHFAQSSLQAGADWQDWIAESVRDANLVFVHLGSSGQLNPWVIMEIGAAWHARKEIIFVMEGDQPEPQLLRDLGIHVVRLDADVKRQEIQSRILESTRQL